ncbi:MAG: hypothetical protein JNM69_19120 [Archangium sp.]|nr:hypothetical protein [Archangium sp.]
MRSFSGLLVLISCAQPVEFGPQPAPPTGRLRPGLERCSSVSECSAGSCFVSVVDDVRYCTGANDRSPCDVITCDAPAQCWCLASNPLQCGCAITTHEP